MTVRLPGTPQTWLDKAVFKDEEERYEIELAEARKSGRYPFHVAARLIAKAAGPCVSADKFEERLMLAARDSSLPVYTMGQTLRWDGENQFFATLEIFADDLNTWLATNERRIHEIFQFPGSEQNDAPAKIGVAPPAIVDAGDTATEDGSQQETAEPFLQKGTNSRAGVGKWVAWQASDKVEEGDRVSDLADRILLLAKKWGYESARGEMTLASITKMIPAGLTGGRAKNKGRSKNQPQIIFGKGEIKVKSKVAK